MNEYTIAFNQNRDRLIEECNELIASGWTPQGGVAMSPISAGGDSIILFLQAFIK